MLTTADLAKPISHEARRELAARETEIKRLTTALERIAAWRYNKNLTGDDANCVIKIAEIALGQTAK